MEVKRKSRTEIRKQLYAFNQRHILTEGGLSINEYNDLWIDAGKQFLSELYPPDDDRYANYYHHYHGKRCFWRWWLKKWKDWEIELIREAKDCEVVLEREIYKDAMLPIIYSNYVHHNFVDYQKQLENVL